MFSIWIEEFWGAFLKGLTWPAPRQAVSQAPAEPASAPSFTETASSFPATEPSPDPVSGIDEEADEDTEEADLDWPVMSVEEIAAARAAAEAQALSGPHRIFPSSPAGPGSLFEALKRLEELGRVSGRFVEDPVAGPHLAYAPL